VTRLLTYLLKSYWNYCDYRQRLKFWIEVSLHTARFALRFARLRLAIRVARLVLAPTEVKWLSGYSARHEALAQVGSGWCGLAQSEQRTLWVSELRWTLVTGRLASLRWFNRRLLTCILLSDSTPNTQHLHTHYPLSLSLLASVGTRVRVTAFASVLARRGSLDSGSLDSLTRRRGRTNLVTLLLVRCETVGKLSLTDFLSHR